MRSIRAIPWLAAALWAVSVAGAGVGPGAGSVVTERTGRLSHGWVIVGPDPTGVYSLLHIPPRASEHRQDGIRGGAPDGSVSTAARVEASPQRLAAWGDTVAMVFPPVRGGEEGSQRRVLRLTAVASATSALWTFSPPDRPAVLPSLPGEGQLYGFAGTDEGFTALIGDSQRLSLLALREGRWVDLPLPDLGGAGADRWELLSRVTGIRLLRVRAGSTVLWEAIRNDPAQPASLFWSDRLYPATLGSVTDRRITSVGDRLVWSHAIQGQVTIGLVEPTGIEDIARIEGVGRDHSLIPLDSSNRIALIWEQPGAMRPEVCEVSVGTGRVLYRGETKAIAPFSAGEFRMLLVLLGGVGTGVIVFLIRGVGADQSVNMAEGTALAEPSRRMMAGILDLLPGAFIGARVFETSVWEVLGVFGLVGAPHGLWPLAMALAIGFGHTVVSEWIFRRSIGKVLVGCEVVGIDGGQRIRAWQSLVRNAVRWGAPPVALAGLLDRRLRHWGDVAARTVVIVRLEAEEAERGEGDDR